MLQQAARDFLMLLVTIDPIGTVALFVPLTASAAASERSRIAWKAVIVAGCVLIAFLVAGELLLTELGIRLVSFQVAGGIILFLFGIQMVFGTGVMAERAKEEPGHDVAVFPLALPGIANPGAIMAVVLLTDNHRHSVAQQAVTAVILIVVLILTLLALLLSKRIHKLLGSTGANVLIRVMGLLLAALAIEQIATALQVLLRPAAG
jgi:multiple antibiotic resistance protein